jgi:hypothetical protein
MDALKRFAKAGGHEDPEFILARHAWRRRRQIPWWAQ